MWPVRGHRPRPVVDWSDAARPVRAALSVRRGTIVRVTTVLQYLVIAAAIGGIGFAVAVFVFGRGEQMAPLPARTSPAELPDGAITGQDVRSLRFAMAVRGYRMSDVDWALERMAVELDGLRAQLADRTEAADPADSSEPAPVPADDLAERRALTADRIPDATASGPGAQ